MSPVAWEGKAIRLRYRLGADSSIVASEIIASPIIARHRHLLSLRTISNRSMISIYLRPLAPWPLIAIFHRASVVHRRSSTLARPPLLVNRRFIHH
jgi:hypothetical protein